MVSAHRYSFQRANGPVDPGEVLRHGCDEASCQEPSHIVEGTAADNYWDWHRRRHRRGGPLRDVRGAAGRARAIRDAILAAGGDPACQEAAALAAAAAGDPDREQLLLPAAEPLSW